MELITDISHWVAALAHLYMALRLFTFRRGQRRYRRHISILAWLLFNATLITAFWLIAKGLPFPSLAPPYAVLCVYLSWLLQRRKGNLGDFF